METTSEKNKYVFKNAKHDGIGFAILLITVGGVLFLLNLDILPAIYKPVLISWQMLLIVLGVWSIIKRNYISALVLILLGLFFIYPKVCVALPDVFPCANFSIKTYWPLILIVIGVVLIASRSFHWKCHRWRARNYGNRYRGQYDYASYDSADFVHKNLIFGSSEQIVLSQNFKGGEANVIFGELNIDLRKAVLAEGTSNMEINAVFGSVFVYIPSDWVVEINGSSVFGGIVDSRNPSVAEQQENTSRLIVEASAVFGSCEIRN